MVFLSISLSALVSLGTNGLTNQLTHEMVIHQNLSMHKLIIIQGIFGINDFSEKRNAMKVYITTCSLLYNFSL